MNHPLDGCFARLDRAEVHIEALKTAFIETDSEVRKSIKLKLQLDLERNRLKIFVADDVVFPVRVGVVFGDVVHNLHAALDNLVYELGRLDGKTPGSDSQFPILNHPNEWFTDDVRRSLAFVRPQDRTRIEAHQPFMRPGDQAPKDHVLARLKRYSNEGKHRVVTPVGGTSMGWTVDQIEPTDFRVVEVVTDIQKALRKDAVIGDMRIEITGPDPKVSMKTTLAFYPSLDNGDPAEQFLRLAHAYVNRLITDFRDESF